MMLKRIRDLLILILVTLLIIVSVVYYITVQIAPTMAEWL